MLLSFKTALIPNNRQITAFRKASGVARHAYNWANAQIKDILAAQKEGEKLKLPSAIVWKVLDETDNLQKPNPPSLQGNGGFKAYPRVGERFGEGFIYTLKTFQTSLSYWLA